MGPSAKDTIPAFLSIDVEPNGFQLAGKNLLDWSGYDRLFEFADQLRSNLAERTGAPARFGWYFRMDSQIVHVYGRPDYILAEYPERIALLHTNGDYFGVHTHPVRWCTRRRLWVHEFSDRIWLLSWMRASFDAYADWSDSLPERLRTGAGFLTNDMIDVAEQCGVKIILSLESGAQWSRLTRKVASGIDESPMVGRHISCRTAPREAYRPSKHDFRISAGSGGRNLLMVPLTTGPILQPNAFWRKLVRRVILGSDFHVLFPSADWPSATFYWDLVERQLQKMDCPYLSLAIRTDSPDSVLLGNACRLFEELPKHRLAEHLRFVDPLEVTSDLVPNSH